MVKSSGSIVSDDTFINITNTDENELKVIENVKDFSAENQFYVFMPQGLELVFRELFGIQILNCELTELRQKDLINHPNLKNLRVEGNHLKSINSDVFKFNPELKVLGLRNNKLFKISPSALKGLIHLKVLWLSRNPCIYSDAKNIEDVPYLIQSVKEKCSPDDENEVTCSRALEENEVLMAKIDERNVEIKRLEMELRNAKRDFANLAFKIVMGERK